jgi:hypothetical protein
MLVKIVTLFLIGMAVLAMFGRLRMPKVRLPGRRTCKACGRPLVGRGECPCRKVPRA